MREFITNIEVANIELNRLEATLNLPKSPFNPYIDKVNARLALLSKDEPSAGDRETSHTEAVMGSAFNSDTPFHGMRRVVAAFSKMQKRGGEK